jgi:hypothetical protein
MKRRKNIFLFNVFLLTIQNKYCMSTNVADPEFFPPIPETKNVLLLRGSVADSDLDTQIRIRILALINDPTSTFLLCVKVTHTLRNFFVT